MRFTETKINGVWIIEPERREDHRGFFARTWCQKEFEDRGLNPRVKQMNAAFTAKKSGVRGLHFQLAPHQEAKTVRCTMGAIFDVAVDVRPDSPTYKQWVGAELSADNRRALYIPEGCAHGYQTLADDTEILYLTSAFYVPESARGYRYDDPAFAISWPLPVGVISTADLSWPSYDEEEAVNFSATRKNHDHR
jgi:dTDP-4-dehydrorhamnose 3,5-epimerase